MKILLVTPYQGEFEEPFLRQKTNIIQKIKSEASTHDVDILSLQQVNMSTTTLKDIQQILVDNSKKIADADIIHTFSEIPLLFRSFFPGLLILSLNKVFLNSKLPEHDEPGFDVAPTDKPEELIEFYLESYNNRRKNDDRPWGYWESLKLNDRYKVKHIYVAPGEKLSLQTHKHRDEIWSIVDGNGIVTRNEEKLEAEIGKVFLIKKGEVHRAEGGADGLHIVEVQLGEYLGEDDIVRLEDIYGRK